MALQRRTRLSTAEQADQSTILSSLDGDALVQVLLAARATGILGQLASSSRQLCSFARSRVPVRLFVGGEEHAGLIIRSHACGRPPFSSCTELVFHAQDAVMCCLGVGVLNAAHQWTGLQQLELRMPWRFPEQVDGLTLEYCAASLLSCIPSLRQLRHLMLEVPALGASCAGHIQQLTQLTYLQLTARAAPAGAAAADLAALSRLTNLVELRLAWALAPHLPASPEGPFCLPSSVVTLELSSWDQANAALMACWVAHLPGCPQLQDLQLRYGPQQHASTHPSVLVRQLAQHHPQLRSLNVTGCAVISWCAPVAGLPAAAAPGARSWRPDPALAALTGLQSLYSGCLLDVKDQADWQHLAQLTALGTLGGVRVSCVPELEVGSAIRVLDLHCSVELGGYALGQLLLACPLLERADISVQAPAAAAAGARLPPHPNLRELVVEACSGWGDAAAAAAHFGHLAPVLSSVSQLDISEWDHGSNRADVVMPDLSPCTALTALTFDGRSEAEPPLEQEALLSMVAPLVQLQSLYLYDLPRVNARVALALQSMLPQLQLVTLERCGYLLPVTKVAVAAEASSDDEDEDEFEVVEDPQEPVARQAVLRLLRDGLVVDVSRY